MQLIVHDLSDYNNNEALNVCNITEETLPETSSRRRAEPDFKGHSARWVENLELES